MRTSRVSFLCLMALLRVCAVRADLPTRIDITPVDGCTVDHPAVIEVSEALNEVARELSHGGDLKTAFDGVGYAAATAELLDLRSPMNEDAIREVIEDRYCTAGSKWGFTEFGIYRRGNEMWIVLSAPIEHPTVEDAALIAMRVLELVNLAREQPRRCGDQQVDAARPLILSTALGEAASRHAVDMAEHASFEHVGSDGSQPSQRVSEAGYRWRATGENIAAGQSSAEAVVDAWLGSAKHCANMMGAQYTEMGVAFALARTKKPAIYWTLELASPR